MFLFVFYAEILASSVIKKHYPPCQSKFLKLGFGCVTSTKIIYIYIHNLTYHSIYKLTTILLNLLFNFSCRKFALSNREINKPATFFLIYKLKAMFRPNLICLDIPTTNCRQLNFLKLTILHHTMMQYSTILHHTMMQY